jgi:hypothetical protein
LYSIARITSTIKMLTQVARAAKHIKQQYEDCQDMMLSVCSRTKT